LNCPYVEKEREDPWDIEMVHMIDQLGPVSSLYEKEYYERYWWREMGYADIYTTSNYICSSDDKVSFVEDEYATVSIDDMQLKTWTNFEDFLIHKYGSRYRVPKIKGTWNQMWD